MAFALLVSHFRSASTKQSNNEPGGRDGRKEGGRQMVRRRLQCPVQTVGCLRVVLQGRCTVQENTGNFYLIVSCAVCIGALFVALIM